MKQIHKIKFRLTKIEPKFEIKTKFDMFIDLFSSVFRIGYIPIASGTFGTLAAIPLVIMLRIYLNETFYISITAALIILSCIIANQAERLYNKSDSSKIVIDEVVGYLITCAFLPSLRWDFLLIGFFVFRFFDILKLWPGSYFDRKHGGYAVVLDDVIAGLYSLIVVQLYVYFDLYTLIKFILPEG